MRKLEEKIVESLTALRCEESEAERHMFVFPLSLMGGFTAASLAEDCVVRLGEVARLCRPPCES